MHIYPPLTRPALARALGTLYLGIPVGDLFTVMEAWQSDKQIADAMRVILDIEHEASSAVTMQPGLLALLALLKERQV